MEVINNRVVVVKGILGEPRFGLSEEEFNRIALQVSKKDNMLLLLLLLLLNHSHFILMKFIG